VRENGDGKAHPQVGIKLIEWKDPRHCLAIAHCSMGEGAGFENESNQEGNGRQCLLLHQHGCYNL
jgi:hypothetical protein